MPENWTNLAENMKKTRGGSVINGATLATLL